MNLIARVRARIIETGLTEPAAARQIGVGSGTLRRHLSGEYVRSDSAAKYRLWLDRRRSDSRQTHAPTQEPLAVPAAREVLPEPKPPSGGWRIVDLFSGCGGLSLGFELTGQYRLQLAADNDPAALGALRRNRQGAHDPTRAVDLAGFLSETEILAWYLDHVAAVDRDRRLAQGLDAMPTRPLEDFKRAIRALDTWYARSLTDLRSRPEWRALQSEVDPVVLRQTSVLGFHDRLGLPRPSARVVSLPPLPWHERRTDGTAAVELASEADPAVGRQWRAAVDELTERARSRGARGQLAASARRISQFVELLSSDLYERQRTIWVAWANARLQLRRRAFPADVRPFLDSLYHGRRVEVLLGGPPCQGFSRIGRGKIRSLREHGVHVQADSETGDTRNRLLEAYVQWVGALQPDVFLFENVRHFQSTVRTAEGTFTATSLLAEAIQALSDDRLEYEVASTIVDASRHGVPQARERFFMVGTRRPSTDRVLDPAAWMLRLPIRGGVPLRVALDGLGSAASAAEGLSTRTTAARPAATCDAEMFAAWVSSEVPLGSLLPPGSTDAHVARASREDDAAWFRLMGPGRRWMDYRCDGTDTLERLRSALITLANAVSAVQAGASDGPGNRVLAEANLEDLGELMSRVDGALSLRLLLERIEPRAGELTHHLLTPTYLGKREGNHGDWLARLDPERPSKTIVSHMSKDTYAYVHPWEPRTLSVREAARVQTFPDWFSFGEMSLVDAYRALGNAVPPLLAAQLAERVGQLLTGVAQRSADDASELHAAS